VAMRTRNPWVFLRRRLFGWNVRFMVCPWERRTRPLSSTRCRTFNG